MILSNGNQSIPVLQEVSIQHNALNEIDLWCLYDSENSLYKGYKIINIFDYIKLANNEDTLTISSNTITITQDTNDSELYILAFSNSTLSDGSITIVCGSNSLTIPVKVKAKE
jgi:hypothetical protein